LEESRVVGGAQINTGTIPSKALREAAMHLTGRGQRGLFGESYRVKRNVTVANLIAVSRQPRPQSSRSDFSVRQRS